jgi:hypothetical protein
VLQVLKMLGVKKYGTGGRYLPGSGGGTTGGRRRLYGSLSSLPSSVSSRPVRERRGRQDDRKRVKDVKVDIINFIRDTSLQYYA